MATLRRKSKTGSNAARYMWVALTLMMLGVVSFAVSSTQPALLYVGASLLVLALISAVVFIIKYFQCGTICVSDEDSSCRLCCSICWGKCSCCTAKEEPQTVQQIIAALRSPSNEVQSERVNGEEIFVVRVEEDSIEDKVNNLDTEIARLRQQYEFLKRQECVDDIIEQDYASLDAEQAKVALWKNNVVPTDLQLKAMKGRLKRTARNFRLTRLRIYNQDNSANPNAFNGVPCDVDMDAPEQVRIFATDVPIPPAYSENDPEPSATQHHSDLPAYDSQRPVYSIQGQPSPAIQGITRSDSQLPLLEGGTDTVSMTNSFVPSPNGAYQNNAFLGHLSVSSGFLAPPLDERGAPPAYDEATASPI